MRKVLIVSSNSNQSYKLHKPVDEDYILKTFSENDDLLAQERDNEDYQLIN